MIHASSGLLAMALMMSSPFGADGSEAIVPMDGVVADATGVCEVEEAIATDPAETSLTGGVTSLGSVIVSVEQCQRQYSKGGLLRRACCDDACHRVDVVCYSRCVNGDAPRPK